MVAILNLGFRLVALRSSTYGEWESKNDSLIRTKNGIRLGLMQYKNLLTDLEDVVGPALSKSYDLERSPVPTNIIFSARGFSRHSDRPNKKDVCVGGGGDVIMLE